VSPRLRDPTFDATTGEVRLDQRGEELVAADPVPAATP
jgi:hypothetical protein